MIHIHCTYDEERQVTKPTSPLQSCRSLSFPLHSCRSRYNGSRIFLRDYFLHPLATALERERECQNPVSDRQLCSGDIGYVTSRSFSYLFVLPTTTNEKLTYIIWLISNTIDIILIGSLLSGRLSLCTLLHNYVCMQYVQKIQAHMISCINKQSTKEQHRTWE